MRLLIHNKPKLKMPEFKVDEPLSKHLDDPLLSNMNKSFCCGLVGKAGSGKTVVCIVVWCAALCIAEYDDAWSPVK